MFFFVWTLKSSQITWILFGYWQFSKIFLESLQFKTQWPESWSQKILLKSPQISALERRFEENYDRDES